MISDPDLREALDSVALVVSRDPRAWDADRHDAFLYGLFAGWDCELDHAHDAQCDRMAEVAARHDWNSAYVTRLRRLRNAVRTNLADAEPPAAASPPAPAPRGSVEEPADLDAMYDALKSWGRWGEGGALAQITTERRRVAAACVRLGFAVSLARDIQDGPVLGQRNEVEHRMLATGETRGSDGIEGYEATRDFIASDVHGMALTHLDALCHMFVRGEMYDGVSPDAVTDTGASRHSVMATAEGIVGRGVLLDIPAVLQTNYLEPEHLVTAEELELAEARQGVRVGDGDLLIVSSGRDAKLREIRKWGEPEANSLMLGGLGPSCLPWLADRGVSTLIGDGISDRLPPRAGDQWPFPIHQIAITAMGIHLVDNARLDRLLEVCRQYAQWDFLLTIAPLRIEGGTGSPVNPVALL